MMIDDIVLSGEGTHSFDNDFGLIDIDVEVSISCTPEVVELNEEVTCTVQYQNNGLTTAEDIGVFVSTPGLTVTQVPDGCVI